MMPPSRHMMNYSVNPSYHNTKQMNKLKTRGHPSAFWQQKDLLQ